MVSSVESGGSGAALPIESHSLHHKPLNPPENSDKMKIPAKQMVMSEENSEGWPYRSFSSAANNMSLAEKVLTTFHCIMATED